MEFAVFGNFQKSNHYQFIWINKGILLCTIGFVFTSRQFQQDYCIFYKIKKWNTSVELIK